MMPTVKINVALIAWAERFLEKVKITNHNGLTENI